MKIMLSEEGTIWNDSISILERYAEDVVVISYYTGKPKKHIRPYKYIDVKIPNMLGHDDGNGLRSLRFHALEEYFFQYFCELLDVFGDAILILTDNNPISLLPYKALQLLECDLDIHLWSISPFSFSPKKEKESYYELVKDLSGTISVLNMRLELSEEHRGMVYPQYIERIQKEVSELFPSVYYQTSRIIDRDRNYFFDFRKGSYIDTNFEKDLTIFYDDDYDFDDLLGDVDDEYWAKIQKEIHLYLVQRSDGKELCSALRKARERFAADNQIDYYSEQCTFDGACGGTCPKCDEELRFLMSEAEKRNAKQLIYPSMDIVGELTILRSGAGGVANE